MRQAAAKGSKYGLPLQTMDAVLNTTSGRSGATERGLPALIEGRASSNFAMALMLKDVSLATQLGMNCGAPMLLHNITRGLLQTGIYQCEEGANTDEVRKVIESMADVKLKE